MIETVKIKSGDFVVWTHRWGDFRAVEVIKISPQLVFYEDDDWGARVRRIRIADVLFSGTKEVAERLAERLNSSSALCEEESMAAADRMRKRDAAYLANAKAQTP